MMPGDIRGEPIQPMFPMTSASDDIMNVAGSAVNLAATLAGPFATIYGMHLFGTVFDQGMAAGEKAVRNIGPISTLIKRAAVADAREMYSAAAKNLPGAVKALRESSLAKLGHSIIKHRKSLGLTTGIAAVAGGYLMSASTATAAATGMGLGAGAFAAQTAFQAPFDDSRQAFINSSNAMMARGASGRNKNRGH